MQILERVRETYREIWKEIERDIEREIWETTREIDIERGRYGQGNGAEGWDDLHMHTHAYIYIYIYIYAYVYKYICVSTHLPHNISMNIDKSRHNFEV